MAERCSATRADGQPCESRIGIDRTGRCAFHSELPERVAKRREGRKRGAQTTNVKLLNRKTVPADLAPARMTSLEDAILWTSWVAHAVATGEIDAKTGDSVTKAVREFRFSLEKRSLGQEVDFLRGLVRDLVSDDEERRERARRLIVEDGGLAA